MKDRALVLGMLATIGAALATAVAQADPPTERFSLDPNVPGVMARASVEQDDLTVAVAGLRAGTRVEAQIDRLACAGGGRGAGGAVSDSAGRARWTLGDALPQRLRDGRHVLAVTVGTTTIACGAIPSPRPAAQPARERHWGTWSFARHFVD